jgi:spore coat polysaccharide biosynthesis protein SpsF (cytidylyltransferase family)
MLKNIKINIAIQARKNSESIPNKSLLKLNNENLTVIDSLLQNCIFCSGHIQKKNKFYEIFPSIWVLVPDGELDFWETFLRGYKKQVSIIGGDETNVFSRYVKLFQSESPDYIVRLTGDCPNVPALAINKLIFTAVHHQIDYLSNSWPDYRTTIDGHDCEIISSRLFNEIINRISLDEYDKLHVTSFIHRCKPTGFSYGMLWTKEDLSDIKTCIDTELEHNISFKRFDSSSRKKHAAISSGIKIFEY